MYIKLRTDKQMPKLCTSLNASINQNIYTVQLCKLAYTTLVLRKTMQKSTNILELEVLEQCSSLFCKISKLSVAKSLLTGMPFLLKASLHCMPSRAKFSAVIQ